MNVEPGTSNRRRFPWWFVAAAVVGIALIMYTATSVSPASAQTYDLAKSTGDRAFGGALQANGAALIAAPGAGLSVVITSSYPVRDGGSGNCGYSESGGGAALITAHDTQYYEGLQYNPSGWIRTAANKGVILVTTSTATATVRGTYRIVRE